MRVVSSRSYKKTCKTKRPFSFLLFVSFGRSYGFENRAQKRLSGEFTRYPRGWSDLMANGLHMITASPLLVGEVIFAY
jgi:hypothetical protein